MRYWRLVPALAVAIACGPAIPAWGAGAVSYGSAGMSMRILRPGSYLISAPAAVRPNRTAVGPGETLPGELSPNDPRASFVCPAVNDQRYSNECAQTVIGIAPQLNCFFTDMVVPVRTHDGNYSGVAGMQVVGWPYNPVSTSPIRLWYVYWLNIFNQPLTGYGHDRMMYATATCT